MGGGRVRGTRRAAADDARVAARRAVDPRVAERRAKGTLAGMARRLTIPGIVLIAVAATLWGTDALFRRPLAQSTSATTIVFGEHVVLLALTLPFLIPALRGLIGAGWRYVAAGVAVGA